MLNAPRAIHARAQAEVDPRNPENWGPADPLPLARFRGNRTLIDEWRERGNLHPAQEAAALEIEHCHRALTAGLWTKTSCYDERVSKSLERDWPARIAIALRDRYGPWRDEMAALAKKGEPVQTILFAALIDGYSLRQLDRERKWRKGKAALLIKRSLWRYAVIAGWVEER